MLPGSYIIAWNSSVSAAALNLKYSKKVSDETCSLRFHGKQNSRFRISALNSLLRNQEKERNIIGKRMSHSAYIKSHNSMFVYIIPIVILTKKV